MKFTITFHTPFHVSTGTSEKGLDRLVDVDNPLPASSLKGRMRAAASEDLGLPSALVDDVFGHVGAPSPWWWSDAEFDSLTVRNITQIKVNDRSGTSERGFLMFGQHVWATTAVFDVVRRVVQADRFPDHELVLRASARAITSLGGQRRRGEGWVTISEGPWTSQDTRRLIAMRGQA